MRFIDEVEIVGVSGKGGDGCASFRREKFVPRGGPDGGDGGKGGDLIFEASRRKNTLIDFRRNKVYRAGNGLPGKGKQMNGRYGDDVVLLVPVGTVLYDADTDEALADLDEEGARFVMEGGRGGAGNIRFKTSTNRTPRQSTPGKLGEERRLRLELKLMADVGLLGFPNAGKSTFISRVSRAHPKVADYPFTTLVPSLGVVSVGDDASFVIADIPGLIRGAAEGAGLGHQFLRHVERCSLYLHLIAPDGEDDPLDRYEALNAELQKYDASLLDRPQIVVLTKTDLLSDEDIETWTRALSEASGRPVASVSSVSGQGLKKLLGRVWALIDDDDDNA